MKKQVYAGRVFFTGSTHSFLPYNGRYTFNDEKLDFLEFMERILGEGNLILDTCPATGRAVYHHPESSTTLLCDKGEKNTIVAYGREEDIREVEKGLVEKVKMAEVQQEGIAWQHLN